MGNVDEFVNVIVASTSPIFSHSVRYVSKPTVNDFINVRNDFEELANDEECRNGNQNVSKIGFAFLSSSHFNLFVRGSIKINQRNGKGPINMWNDHF